MADAPIYEQGYYSPPGALDGLTRLARALPDLAEDIRITHTWQTSAGGGGSGTPTASMLYKQFRESTTDKERAVAVDEYLSVDDWMRRTTETLDAVHDHMIVRQGEGAAVGSHLDQPGVGEVFGDFHLPAVDCTRCTYLGQATPLFCRTQPDHVIRLHSPPDAEEAYLLCFDVAELNDLVRQFRKSGARWMRHPVRTLGITGGKPVPLTLFPATIEADTIGALEWQIAAWHEWSVLQRARAGANSRGYLHNLIIPAMVKFIEERIGGAFGTTSRLGRFWKKGVSAAVRGAAAVLRWVQHHPSLMAAAVMIAEIFHSFVCLAVFGKGDAFVEEVLDRMFLELSPTWQIPGLQMMFRFLKATLMCSVLGMPAKCLQNTVDAIVNFPNDIKDIVCGTLDSVMAILRFDEGTKATVRALRGANLLQTFHYALWFVTGGRFGNAELVAEVDHKRFIELLGRPLYDQMWWLMVHAAGSFGAGVVLYCTRFLTLNAVLSALRRLASLVGNGVGIVVQIVEYLIGLAEASVGFVAHQATLHDLVIRLLNDARAAHSLWMLFEFMRTASGLLQCAVEAVRSFVLSLFPGGPDSVLAGMNDRSCCVASLLEHFTEKKAERDAEIQEKKQEQERKQRKIAAAEAKVGSSWWFT